MTHLFFNLSSSLLLFDFNPLLFWKEKLNNFLNQRLSLFARSHEACDPCFFDQENFKQSENKRSKNYKLAKHVLAIRILKTTNNPKSKNTKHQNTGLAIRKCLTFKAFTRLCGLIFVKNRSESRKKVQ